MFRIIKNRFALSEKGVRDFLKGVFFTTMLDIVLMLPAVFVFLFLEDYLRPVLQSSNIAIVHGFTYYLLLAIAFMVVMYVFALWQYKSTFVTVYDESAARRISLAEKLRKLPLAFFGRKNLSDLTSTIMEDSTQLEHTFSHTVPQLYASVVSITFIGIGLFFYNWQLSLALFWVVPLAAAVTMLPQKLARKGHLAVYQAKREVTDQVQEGLETIRELKAYHLETAYLAQLNAKADYFEKQLIKGELLVGSVVNSAQSVLKLGLATVIIAGASLLVSAQVDLFTYFIFLMVGSRIYNPIDEVFNNLAALTYLDIRIKRMKEMEDMPVQEGSKDFHPDNFNLVFDQVAFSYEEGRQVLKGVSFEANQGEVTALVGPSGCGKSTLTRLAARFWDVNQGTITLGGLDIRQIDPETLLESYSIIFQDVVLFNTTIMDNIRLGRRNATDEEVMHMARLAQCEEFILKMPKGYKTLIGENGATLSGGERQRISIARALLKDAPIVLLDEATAALDAENETKIQAALSELIKDKTVLIIAHRMRTIVNADKVVVLENGSVCETGSPDALKIKDGLFSRMVKRQMNGSVIS